MLALGAAHSAYLCGISVGMQHQADTLLPSAAKVILEWYSKCLCNQGPCTCCCDSTAQLIGFLRFEFPTVLFLLPVILLPAD